MNKWLTPAAHKMLKQMRDGEDEYVAVEGIQVWVDHFKFSIRTFYKLVRLCLIRKDSYSDDKCETWLLNDDGRTIIDDESFEPPIIEILRKKNSDDDMQALSKTDWK